MTDSDQQGSERVDVDRQTEQGPANRELTGSQRRAERRTAIALAVTVVAGIGLFIVYFAGGQTQVEGVLFAVALGGLGVALGIWANHLLDAREVVEERHELSSGAAGREAFGDALSEEVGPVLAPRPVCVDAAEQPVVTRPAAEPIGVVHAAQHVVAGAGGQQILAAGAAEAVVAGLAE